MVEKFQDIFKKALSGEYKYLYPVHFHKALTQVHTIFGDRKQVCIEFIISSSFFEPYYMGYKTDVN